MLTILPMTLPPLLEKQLVHPEVDHAASPPLEKLLQLGWLWKQFHFDLFASTFHAASFPILLRGIFNCLRPFLLWLLQKRFISSLFSRVLL